MAASPPLLAGFNLIAQTDSSNYFESQANGMTYLEAQDFCLSKGGRLATFESAAENALVQGSAVGHIGLWKNNGTWKWITDLLDYASWSPADIKRAPMWLQSWSPRVGSCPNDPLFRDRERSSVSSPPLEMPTWS